MFPQVLMVVFVSYNVYILIKIKVDNLFGIIYFVDFVHHLVLRNKRFAFQGQDLYPSSGWRVGSQSNYSAGPEKESYSKHLDSHVTSRNIIYGDSYFWSQEVRQTCR